MAKKNKTDEGPAGASATMDTPFAGDSTFGFGIMRESSVIGETGIKSSSDFAIDYTSKELSDEVVRLYSYNLKTYSIMHLLNFK